MLLGAEIEAAEFQVDRRRPGAEPELPAAQAPRLGAVAHRERAAVLGVSRRAGLGQVVGQADRCAALCGDRHAAALDTSLSWAVGEVNSQRDEGPRRAGVDDRGAELVLAEQALAQVQDLRA